MYEIAQATPNRNFTVTIRWKYGPVTTVDFKPNLAKGGVFAPMADPEVFVGKMYVDPEGYHLGWPEEIDFCADSLWYRTNPEDLKRDFPGAAAK
jgi:hypothetical protein